LNLHKNKVLFILKAQLNDTMKRINQPLSLRHFPAIWKKECPKNKGIRVEPPAYAGARNYLFFGYLFSNEASEMNIFSFPSE